MQLLAMSASAVTLSWDASIGTNVAGYKVYYGAASRDYTNTIDAGNVTSLSVSGLVQGVTYYFAVTAYTAKGLESDFSNEAEYTVPIPDLPPTLNAIASVTINEDGGAQTVNLSGISSGAGNQNQTVTVTASSSNTGLIPTPTVNYANPDTTGSLNFAPVANASGVAIITVTVDDGVTQFSRAFAVTVNAVNDAPTLAALNNVTINEDAAQQTISLSGITSGAANENQTLTVTASSSNTGLIPTPTIIYTSPNSTGSLRFTPVADANGTATITVTVDDGINQFSRTFVVTVNAVNDTPTLAALNNVTINEDAAQQTISLSGITSGAANENQTLTLTAISSNTGLIPTPTIIYSSPNSTGSLRFTPVADANGVATITVTVDDGAAQFSRTFNVTVNAVNDAPTLNAIGNMTLNENAGLQTVSLSGITSGAANENQALTVTASSSNTGLIPTPSVVYTSPNSTGSLRFTPVTDASGIATITVTVDDGVDQISRTFSVAVNSVNSPPTLDPLSGVTINEDAPQQTITLTGITSGAASEDQTLTVTASSSNTGLIPTPTVIYSSPSSTGSLRFTPVADANGTATITVTVSDGQAQFGRTFNVTVNAVNDSPTLNTIGNVTLNENAGLQTVNLSGITSGAVNENQTLTVTASSSNTGLIPTPTVNYTSPNATGSLRFTPVTDASGIATITVTVDDGVDQFSRTFTVAVNSVNNPPTLNPLADVIINEDAPLQTVGLSGIGSGATNENQTLTVTASSSNAGLIPTPTIIYTSPNGTGSLRFTPVADANGVATITVTVSDGQSQLSHSFLVTVNAVNDAPTLNALSDVTLNEDAGQQTIGLSGITSGATDENQTLTVTASSSNTGLIPTPTVVYASPSSIGSLRFIPVANANGTATVTVTISDGSAQFSRTFTVAVNSVNNPPTLNPLSNLTINQGTGQQTVNLSGITSGATNENQALTVTASSSNVGLIPTPTVVYTSPNSTGSLHFAPAANANGTATITVTVSDGAAQISRSFTVVVNVPNGEPPFISDIPDQMTPVNTATPEIPFFIEDAETAASNLVLSATSSDPSLVDDANIIFGGSDGDRTITVIPSPGQTGSVDIAVMVSDGSSISTAKFQLTIYGPSDSMLTVVANGDGTVSPNLVSTAGLTVGRLYTFTAAGGPGQVFTGWTGSTNSTSPSLRIVMTSNLVLQANFAPVTMSINGDGTVSPNLMTTRNLTAGRTYSVSARPGVGQVFAGWSGATNSMSSRVSVMMEPGLNLVATFIPNPYIPVSGTYNGLFYDANEVNLDSAGSFSLTVTSRGTYTGRIQLGSLRGSFSGLLNTNLEGTASITRRGTTPLEVSFRLGTDAEADKVNGSISGDNWVATLAGDRAIFSSRTEPAPFAGTYTVIVPGGYDQPPVEMGEGYGSVRVDTSGRIRLTCTLADNTRVSQSAVVSKDGLWPVYVPLYAGSGSLVSWLAFTNQPDDDINGVMSWIKLPGVRGAYYTEGFTNETKVVGSSYVRPSGTNIVINLPEATVSFEGGNLATDFVNEISIGTGSRVTNLGDTRFSLSFNTSAGTFSGSVTDPSDGVLRRFSGAVLQKLNTGYGFLLGSDKSSRVVISP